MAACKSWGMQINMQLTVFPSHQKRNVACLLETRNNEPVLIFQNTKIP